LSGSGGFSHDAETIAEWVAAKCDGRVCAAFEFLLTLRAGAHCLRQERFKIVNVKVNMNWRPMPLISANVLTSLGRLASGGFLDQSNFRISAFEDDVCRHRSSDLGQAQGIAIKSQALIEVRDVD
jgi:hypothetical protein